MEVNGEAGTGKTNLCLEVAVKCALAPENGGLGETVLFISTVKKFSERRLLQLLQNFSAGTGKEKAVRRVIDRIKTLHLNFDEFDRFFSCDVEEYLEKHQIKMVVIDSFAGLVDVEFIKEKLEVDYYGRTTFLKK